MPNCAVRSTSLIWLLFRGTVFFQEPNTSKGDTGQIFAPRKVRPEDNPKIGPETGKDARDIKHRPKRS